MVVHGQVHEATQHRHIGDVSPLDLVDMRNRQVTQEIRIELVSFVRRIAAATGVDSLNSHQTHQPFDLFAIDSVAQPGAVRLSSWASHRRAYAGIARQSGASTAGSEPTPKPLNSRGRPDSVPATRTASVHSGPHAGYRPCAASPSPKGATFFFSHSSSVLSRSSRRGRAAAICSQSSASYASCSRCLRSPMVAKTLGPSSYNCRFQARIRLA